MKCPNSEVNCNGITSIKIPHSVTSIGETAFEECENLKYVELSGSVGEMAFKEA
ncbi:MAG TPA: leucine-rich repeat protein [Candidatus Limisoma gallistercoris]|nr:leucine-rich repeat protein [Candidatus Limisoma gallistercoris]